MKSINNKELLQNKHQAGIILRPNSKELRDVYLRIKEKFEQHGIKTIIEKISDLQEKVVILLYKSNNPNKAEIEKLLNEIENKISQIERLL